MHTSKQFLIAFIGVAFLIGAVGLVFPTDSQAAFSFKKKEAFPQTPFVKKLFKKTVCGFRNPDDRFVTSKDGKEVCDRYSGNIFEQDPKSDAGRGPMTQPNAIAFCENLDKGHGQVYELSSIQQLVSVLDYTEKFPALTPDVFDNVLSSVYWSASLVSDDSGRAWAVGVETGDLGDLPTSTPFFVWCVGRGKDAHADW